MALPVDFVDHDSYASQHRRRSISKVSIPLSQLFIIALILAAFAAYYLRFVAKKPQLVYQQKPDMEALVQACPSLHAKYYPTPWAFNTHIQIVLLFLKDTLSGKLVYERSDVLTMSDGGTTSIEWLGLSRGEGVPTVLLLPTITGCGNSLSSHSRYIHNKLGWRVAVCVRRGHGGLPLTAAQVNTLGSTDDLREQLAHIQGLQPESPLYAIGVSAGSGLLVRYLGEEQDKTPIKAAFAYCPGYDTDIAFTRTKPFYSAYMTKKLIRFFLEPNRKSFEDLESFASCFQSRDLDEFHQNCYQMAGFRDYQAYSHGSNPMRVIDNVSIPLMVLNSRDDPVCASQNVDENMDTIASLASGLLVMTSRGSHCAHFDGWSMKPWASQLMVEYLAANHETLKKP
jgi:hypothetical protein